MANEQKCEVQHVIDALLVCTDENYTCLDCNRYRHFIKYEFVSDCVHDLMLEAVLALKTQQNRIAELESKALQTDPINKMKPSINPDSSSSEGQKGKIWD